MHAIADIRKDYKLQSLNETDLADDPFEQFTKWWGEALSSQIDEINAMTLATVTPEGKPDARIVLLKGFSGDGFTFFTNYESRKGQELATNPAACSVFFWKELERQVRIEGTVEKLATEESEVYFKSRPVASQIGALASAQSTVIPNRGVLEERVKELETQYADGEVPKPQQWGGYLLKPERLEFWQGRRSRLHDRLVYKLVEGHWLVERLAP